MAQGARLSGVRLGTSSARRLEIDHLIAISLGGSNDIKNLWPRSLDETKPLNAKLKDRLERRLHVLACIDKKVSLHDAQEAISRDWIAAYRKYIGER
jgi:hypothetical protein